MTERASLGSLRDRLSAIAARDLADRTLTPGEATTLVALIDAANHQVETYEGDTTVNLIHAVQDLRNG